MEPLETDFAYAVSRPRASELRMRFNWLQFLPVLGVCWVAFLTLAVIFQWPITEVVNPLLTLMIMIFFLFVGLFFCAM